VYENGTVECELDNDSGGDITSVSASNGLIGGGQVGALSISANTSYLQKRIINSCDVGSSIRSINKDGSVLCEVDTDSGGDITSIITNNGIIGDCLTVVRHFYRWRWGLQRLESQYFDSVVNRLSQVCEELTMQDRSF
jgi:hypothetical protein